MCRVKGACIEWEFVPKMRGRDESVIKVEKCIRSVGRVDDGVGDNEEELEVVAVVVLLFLVNRLP